MKRKRFIKIMQSKGLQRNKANLYAKAIQKYCKDGLSYEIMAHGEVTILNDKCYFIEFKGSRAFLCSKVFRSPPAISADKYISVGRNINFSFNNNKPFNSDLFQLRQQICNGGR